MTAILNAAPMTNMLGVHDLSGRALVAEPEALPTHLPKVYLYTQKGPLTPQLVSGASMTQMFGDISFDMRQKWATHATELATRVNAKGNAIMVQRVKPDDAAGPATIRISIDVLEKSVQQYEREADGTFTLDSGGAKIAISGGGATKNGYRIKWVYEVVSLDEDDVSTFGLYNSKQGDQVDGQTNSTRYPIMDVEVAHFGSYGNDVGLRLWQPTTASSQALDDRLLTSIKAMSFRIACATRPNALASSKAVATLSAEQYIDACWKVGAIDPNTDNQLYLKDKFIKSWEDLTTPGMPPKWGPFGRIHVYQNYVDTVLGLLYTAEKTAAGAFTDLPSSGSSAADKYLVNMISAVTSNNVPYYAVEMVSNGTGGFKPTENTTVYASGGTDGTMTEAAFGTSVATLLADYADENHPLQDSAKYPESIMYDSGFPLATKYAMCNFISVRKDTAIVLSTHDTAGAALSLSQESSLAVSLLARCRLFPESEYYGTNTMRAVIIGRSGQLMGSQYPKRLPLSIEIASKSADYMGASNGVWKSEKAFDNGEQNIVELFTDVNVTFTPKSVRNKDWDNGLNWVENYDRKSLYFPALQTVYDDDTSVLNNYFTMLACVELQKVGERARRKYSGSSKLTNAQIKERVEQYVIDATTGRFDNRFIIVPDVSFSKADTARGFSWTLVIKIYANNMKTVQTLTIEAHRIEELAE